MKIVGVFNRFIADMVEELETAATLSGSMPMEELLAAKLGLNGLVESARVAKSAFGGLEKRIDEELCDRIDGERADYEGMRFYAESRGFFGVKKGAECPPEFQKSVADDKKIRDFCEGELRAGRTLPEWVTSYIESIVKIRRISR